MVIFFPVMTFRHLTPCLIWLFFVWCHVRLEKLFPAMFIEIVGANRRSSFGEEDSVVGVFEDSDVLATLKRKGL